VKYRNDVFLPVMAKYEARMTCYEGPDLTPVEPNTRSSHCFKMNLAFMCHSSVTSSGFVRVTTILWPKGHSRLVHVSDFVNEASSRLVLRNADGIVEMDARRGEP